MACKPKERAVAFRDTARAGLRQLVARAQKRGRRAVLESAIPVCDCICEKQIALERCGCAEQLDVLCAHPAQVAAQSVQVGAMATADGDGMRHPGRFELSERERAHLYRMVDELVVAVGSINSEAVHRRILPAHRRSETPRPRALTARRQNFHFAWTLLFAERAQEHTRPVEEASRAIQVRAPNREVECIDLDRHADRRIDRL